MKINKRGVAVASTGAALAAVVLGGTTTALWSDSSTLSGATITAGNLEVAPLGNIAWTDQSTDGLTPGVHAIDPAVDRIVPGDTWQGSQDVDVALEGDNMKAQLKLTSASTGADVTGLLADTDGVKLTYTVTDEAGKAVVTDAVVGGPVQAIDLTPANVTADLDGTKDYNVTVTAVFDGDTPDRVRTQTSATLADMGVTLQQVR